MEGEWILESRKTRKEVLEARNKNFKKRSLHSVDEEHRWSKEIRNLNLAKNRNPETDINERMLMAAQEQVLTANNIKSVVEKKLSVSLLRRLCRGREREETIRHVVSECEMLAQNKHHLWRHDNVDVVFHWVMCKRYGFPTETKWYKHTSESTTKWQCKDTKGFLCTNQW